MKTRICISIIKSLLLVVLLTICINNLNSTNNSLLAKTSADNQIYGPNKLNSVGSDKQPDCDGLWVNSEPTKKVYLDAINLKDWGEKSNPSLILETYNSVKNYLIIGHNICYNNKCDQARSQFANIMKLNVGDRVSACLGGVLYSGFIFTSGPIADTRTEVMGDWTGFNTITMFTSYGDCKDAQCSSTQQRWMVAFERE